VKYSVGLPTGRECGNPRFLVELAVLAEEAGWDGVFLEDYVVFQGDPKAPTCDTFAVLAAIAVLTSRIRVGTTVTPLTRRRPWVVARQAAAVDQLSGGRMILGVGTGDTGESVGSDASFTHFGEERDPGRRAAMLDEALAIVAGLWSGDPFSFRGEHFDVREVAFLPLPVQQPRIPIWVGGGYPNKGPTERALRWDGSCLYHRDGRPLDGDDVRDLRARAGQRRFDVMAGGWGRLKDPEAERHRIRAVAEAGATWWGEYVAPDDSKRMEAAVARGPVRIDD
jgi:alkanesulfonate monooxygenase SsuD/methylene tetrahydromethanopterin reductase-like flavin-dependent oxidoreductase (luciferase family)